MICPDLALYPVGAVPVFTDVSPENYCIDLDAIEGFTALEKRNQIHAVAMLFRNRREIRAEIASLIVKIVVTDGPKGP